jgi:hypothetical protein
MELAGSWPGASVQIFHSFYLSGTAHRGYEESLVAHITHFLKVYCAWFTQVLLLTRLSLLILFYTELTVYRSHSWGFWIKAAPKNSVCWLWNCYEACVCYYNIITIYTYLPSENGYLHCHIKCLVLQPKQIKRSCQSPSKIKQNNVIACSWCQSYYLM